MTHSKADISDRLFDGTAVEDDDAGALQMESALAALHDEDEVIPSKDSWDRIASRIARDEAAPGTETVSAGDGIWEAFAPGIERKIVQIDRDAGLQCYFVRMKAGTELPVHQHEADEHCVIVEGQLEIGGEVYGAGTYHLARKGHSHVTITAKSDALFFIRGAA